MNSSAYSCVGVYIKNKMAANMSTKCVFKQWIKRCFWCHRLEYCMRPDPLKGYTRLEFDL